MKQETKVLQQAFIDTEDSCLGIRMAISNIHPDPLSDMEINDNLKAINRDVAKFPQHFTDPQNVKDFSDYKRDVTAIYNCVHANNKRPLNKIENDLNDHITMNYVDVLFGITE